MSLRRTTPLTLNSSGLSDALDASNVFAGAMASLANLIPDPSTAKLWQCRPASLELVDFARAGSPFSSGFSSGFAGSTFTTPIGPISCLKIIGNVAFGMVDIEGNPNDQPFAYDLVNNAFLPVTGAVAANTPATQAATGAWTTPTMDLVGTNLLVTHPGFNGAGNGYFGWFDIANLAAITWNSGNLTGAVTFTTPPAAVKNFNGRAYWITNPPTGQPALIYSDVLVPRNVTNANQILTFDDNVPLTALAALALQNQLGGIIQALIVFKGITNMYQITGDAATSNLARNALNVATGTLAPNSITQTPKGILFVAPDGLRLIDFTATVSDPIGVDGMGKTLPFLYSTVPTRMYGAANGSIYRITVQDGSLPAAPFVEYWFDWTRGGPGQKGVWSGPHTFPARCIAAYNNTFIVAPQATNGKLFQSDYVQTSTSTFTENGTPLSFTWTTSMLPDTDQMCENAMVETTLYMALVAGGTYAITALNQDGAVLNSALIVGGGTPTIWGQFNWGQAVWGGAANALYPRQPLWTAQVIFRRMQISATGLSGAAVRIGKLHMRYEQLGYLQQSASAA